MDLISATIASSASRFEAVRPFISESAVTLALLASGTPTSDLKKNLSRWALSSPTAAAARATSRSSRSSCDAASTVAIA